VVARFLSVAFHPLVMPCLGLLLLFQMDTYISHAIPGPAKRFLLAVVFINTALAPALAIALLQRTGIISNVLLSERSERMFPLLMASLFYVLTYYLLRQVTLPPIIYYYIMGATLMVLLCLVITFRWKISIHMTSMGGFSGFLIATSLFLRTDISGLIILGFILAGLVGSARLRLNAHTPAQVYAGYLLGLAVMLGLFLYLRV